MEQASELGKKVLRDVSRSFYLSLRVLPSGFREAASVGYLLARISDTIADTEAVPEDERLVLLQKFCGLVLGQGDTAEFESLLSDRFIPLQTHEGERVLMENSVNCLRWLSVLGNQHQQLIRTLLKHITEGQRWDLERFAGNGVVRLREEAELERYTYLVAGCVGEFWTELGFLVDSAYSDESPNTLKEIGRRFGMGLQLVNILRDVPEDLEKGRCYLPGNDGEDPQVLHAAMQPWLAKAEEWVGEGSRYAGLIRGRRMRFASGLPALLGKETLAKLKTADWADLERRVKISRSEVWSCAWRALVASFRR